MRMRGIWTFNPDAGIDYQVWLESADGVKGLIDVMDKLTGDLRWVIVYLNMLNVVETTYVSRPTANLIYGNKRKPFLETSTVRIKLPNKTVVNLMARGGPPGHKKKAHEVRGTWAHYPASKKSSHAHLWEPLIKEDRHPRYKCSDPECGCVRSWRPEHQRGDASLGFVNHQYSVEKRVT